jgi:hypothetical protein
MHVRVENRRSGDEDQRCGDAGDEGLRGVLPTLRRLCLEQDEKDNDEGLRRP